MAENESSVEQAETNPTEEAPVEVVEEAVEEAPTEEAKGLSTEDALEVAIEFHKQKEADAKAKRDEGLEVSYKGERGRREAKLPEEPKPYDAPAEFSAEEKADFLASTRKQQEAVLRLHNSRKSTIEEIRRGRSEIERERAELSHLSALSKDIEPFIRAMGGKDTPAVAMQKALRMYFDFQNAENPEEAAAEYLRAKGKADLIPEHWVNKQKENAPHPELGALRKEIEELKMERAKERYVSSLQQRADEFHEFLATKNAAGNPKYPSVRRDDTSEEGVRLASFFGSLVSGESQLSKEFIARTQARIPNLTRTQLLEEAYRFAGGLVDDAAPARTQSTQRHIIQSNRAASSRPGNSSRVSGLGKKGSMSTEDAIKYAVGFHREQEGN